MEETNMPQPNRLHSSAPIQMPCNPAPSLSPLQDHTRSASMPVAVTPLPQSSNPTSPAFSAPAVLDASVATVKDLSPDELSKSAAPASGVVAGQKVKAKGKEKSNKVRKSADSSKKSTKSRAGVPNYSDPEIGALLGFVEDVEPLGSNHWAIVAHSYNDWARANDRPQREQDSLKNKFDKLAGPKKKPGTLPVQRMCVEKKNIARDIQAKCCAMTLDGESDDEEGTTNSVGGNEVSTDGREGDNATVGERGDKRKAAATGTPTKKKAKNEDLLLGHIRQMAEHMGNMCRAMGAAQSSFTAEDVTKIVKDEVKESMKPTNEMLMKMHGMLKNITSQSRNLSG